MFPSIRKFAYLLIESFDCLPAIEKCFHCRLKINMIHWFIYVFNHLNLLHMVANITVHHIRISHVSSIIHICFTLLPHVLPYKLAVLNAIDQGCDLKRHAEVINVKQGGNVIEASIEA